MANVHSTDIFSEIARQYEADKNATQAKLNRLSRKVSITYMSGTSSIATSKGQIYLWIINVELRSRTLASLRKLMTVSKFINTIVLLDRSCWSRDAAHDDSVLSMMLSSI
jgi:hypothetical protein